MRMLEEAVQRKHLIDVKAPTVDLMEEEEE